MSAVELTAPLVATRPRARLGALAEGWHIVGASLLAAALACIPVLLNTQAYFNDDQQTQYIPTFMAIGKALLNGHWPLLSLHAAYGGDLVGEFQYGLFNPLILGLAALVSCFHDMAFAAGVLAIVHYAILGGGTFLLARTCGANRVQSYVAVCAIATNSFLFYWYASSWLPGLMSLAPMTFACAFLLRASDSRACFLAAVACTALTVTTGWPHAILMLGVFSGLAFAVLIFDRKIGAALACAGAAAIGLALVAIAPAQVVAMAAVGARNTIGAGNSGLFVPNLASVLSVSSPFQTGMLHIWTDLHVPSYAPIFHVAWYVLPLAPFLDWRRSGKTTAFRVVALFAAVALLATQGPSFLFGLRVPLRYLSFLHVGLIAITAVALSYAPTITRGRIFLSGALIAVGACLSWQNLPSIGSLIALSTVLVAGGTVLVCRSDRRTEGTPALILATGVVLFFALTHLAMPRNPAQPSYGIPPTRGAIVDLAAAPTHFAFYTARDKEFFGRSQPGFPSDLTQHVPVGAVSLVQGEPAFINGYSPVGHDAFRALFRLETHGLTDAQIPSILESIDPATGASFADLLRVDEIRARKGSVATSATTQLGTDWRRTDGESTVAWHRTLPNAALPGTLSWQSSGVSVAPSGERATAQRETLQVTDRSGGTDSLIFARLAWPGYRAFLGEREMPVRSHEDFLLKVDLPPEAGTGVLRLQFGLSFVAPCLALAACAFLALALALIFGRFGRDRREAVA